MIELLVRLEDELYEQCKNTKLTEENEGFDFHVIKSVANGTPLDKIRAEIEAIIGERNLDDYDFCSGLICARKIIDKYIESEEQ